MDYIVTPLLLVGLLIGPFVVIRAFGTMTSALYVSNSTAGTVGIAAVFLFTGISHFTKSFWMTEMLPGFVTQDLLLVYITGALVMIAGLAVLFGRIRVIVGWALIIMLICFLPINIYAAINQVGPGGHSLGPIYLVARIPLQFLFIAWTYFFAIHLVKKAELAH